MKRMGYLSGMVILLGFLSLGQAYGQWSFNGTHIYNNNTGNVGIGNHAPAKLLYVGKNMTEPTAVIRNFGGSGGSTFEMIDDASGADWKFKATTNGGFKIRDNANAVDVMTFLPTSGNVGIGAANPTRKFEVNGKVRFANESDYTFLYINLPSAWPGGNSGIIYDYNNSHKAWMYWNNADNVLRFSTEAGGGRNDLVVAQDGKVGVNEVAPDAFLRVTYDANSFSRFCYTASRTNYIQHYEQEANGDNQSGLFVARYRDARNDGTAYGLGSTNQAIDGYNEWGDSYSFALAGHGYMDYPRSGATLGSSIGGSNWGVLSYSNSASTWYGGYFTSYTTGSGKSGAQPEIGIGIGAWGDLFGADIHGKVYGAYVEGENYAIYSHGDMYKDKLDIHLQKDLKGDNEVLYTNVSADVTVMTSGTVTLSGGKASVAFDPVFASVVSKDAPIVITVTPTGQSNGIYLSESSSTGFAIAENNAGKSNITVNYIAVGKRAGYEKPVLPAEVVASDYDSKLARGLHADADLQTNGEGLYYENGQLTVGIHPSTLPDPNRKSEDVIYREEVKTAPGGNLDSAFGEGENEK